jgi:putative DNA methylase
LAYRKKLIEVSLPLDAINAASAREKSIRHGHPSTLHLWWARRPLAACRAVLFGQLVDDPSACEDEFRTKEEQDSERERLHGIIEAMVPWEASTNETILHAARYEIARSVARNGGPPIPQEWRKAAHADKVIDYLQLHAPPVHDPFCGGGSIPLEAQRLGLRARGSDLNPVAVLISKALVEFPPKFNGLAPVNSEADRHKSWKGAEGLADDVRYYGRWMRDEAQKRIGHLYPEAMLPNGDPAKVIAWLWVRTVGSPDPRARGAHVPLASSFVISTKNSRSTIVVPVIDRENLSWTFRVDSSPSADDLVGASAGTKAARGANFVCLLTGSAIDEKHIKNEAAAGRMRHRLMAIVVESGRGRIYLSATEDHERLALETPRPEAPAIDQPVPSRLTGGTCYGYGLTTFEKLFTSRQLNCLVTYSDLVASARERVLADAKQAHGSLADRSAERLSIGGSGAEAYADAVATYLALAVSKLSDAQSSLTRWSPKADQAVGTFARQALPMLWDFAESNTFNGMAGDISVTISNMTKVLDRLVPTVPGTIENQDAMQNGFESPVVFSTDPPYYDNIGYADLSDYFYVWQRRSLLDIHPDLFRRVVTPKSDELVASSYRHKGRDAAERFFLNGMKRALSGIACATGESPTCIYYAFKQTELSADGMTSPGWATFLQAIYDCGLMIDGTWPVRSERETRTIASETNALASSIVLSCRRRATVTEAITRADFLRRLRSEMPDALVKIRAAGVGPTDIQQAAIGPGIGIFTRYSAVLNPDGSVMSVSHALKLINQVREELASEAQGDYDAPTRFAIDWFMVHGHKPSRSGEAITIANALGLGLVDLERAGIFKTGEGLAQLMPRDQLGDGWSPGRDRYPTAWEACQHLIRRLEAADGGVDAAAALFAELGELTEPAHQLAYRLYDICNNKGWAAEAQPYNNLIQEWDVIEERALAFAPQPPAQGEMAL